MKGNPFFIFHDSRSGSTFLARLLVDHCGFIIPPESRFLPKVLKTKLTNISFFNLIIFVNILRKDQKFKDWKINLFSFFVQMINEKLLTPRDLIDKLIVYYYKQHNIFSDNLSFFGFKKGSYIFHIDKIFNVYPESKIVFIIRDGRGVFASKKFSVNPNTNKPFEVDPIKAAEMWIRYIKQYEILTNFYSNVILTKYEHLVEDTYNELKKICTFLGGPTDFFGKYEYHIPSKYKELHKNVKNSSIKSKIYSWKDKLTINEIKEYENIAGNYLKKYGYL